MGVFGDSLALEDDLPFTRTRRYSPYYLNVKSRLRSSTQLRKLLEKIHPIDPKKSRDELRRKIKVNNYELDAYLFFYLRLS